MTEQVPEKLWCFVREEAQFLYQKDFLALSDDEKRICVENARDIETLRIFALDTGICYQVTPNDVSGFTCHLGPLRWFNDDSVAKVRHSAAEFIRSGRLP